MLASAAIFSEKIKREARAFLRRLQTSAGKNHPWRYIASFQARASKWPDQRDPPGLWRWEGQSQSGCWPSALLHSSSSPDYWPKDRTLRSRPQCAAGLSRWDLDWRRKDRQRRQTVSIDIWVSIHCRLHLKYHMQFERVLHTFVPVPRQIFQQPEEQRPMFQCESECTRCADQHSSESKQAECNVKKKFICLKKPTYIN